MSKIIYDRSRLARLTVQAKSARLNSLAASSSFLALRDAVSLARRQCQIQPYDAEATKILRGDRASLQALVDNTPDLEAIGIRPAQLRELLGLLEQLDYAAADAAHATEHSKQQSALVERLEAFIQ